MKTIDTQVLICGAGPTGLSAALLLQSQGIRHHLVERRSGPQRAPAAHVVNARTFEIWRQAGADMDAILAATKDPRDAGWVHWVTKLGGEVLGTLQYEQQGEDCLEYTPTPLRNLSQHRLEPILRDIVQQRGTVVHYQHQWEGAVQDADGVTSQIREVDSGEVYQVRSRYVIAADGAGSPVRKSLGIEPIGPDRIQSFLMIHFEANLRHLVGDKPGVLFWISDPSCSGTLVAHDIDREWVFMLPWDPDNDALANYEPARCEAIVRQAISGDAGKLTIRNVSSWMMTAQIAERYSDGRIFLAGDAAHRFPPTGGLGLNTGVQDAHNLIWKMAAVERGWAPADLLQSYEIERQPVARYNADQSFQNAMRMLEVTQAMGTDAAPEQAATQFAHMLNDAGQRAAVRAAIANQAEHFDMLGLQLGYSYATGALVDDGTPLVQPDNPVRQLLPSSRPGARLPHGWIERDGQRISTLDLIPADHFVLLIGPQAAAWSTNPIDLGIPLQILRLGSDFDDNGWWSKIAAMPPEGALLVRPDQHIAWRWRKAGDESQMQRVKGEV